MAPTTKPPVIIEKPLHNSLSPDLLPRYDPTFVEYYNRYNAGRLATHQVPIEDYRRDPARYIIAFGRQVIDAGDLVISEARCPVEGGGTIAIRVYQPPAAAAAAAEGATARRLLPAYVNYHGGGWVFGNLETDADWCKRVAHDVGCVAFDVDYRLAPENRFPVPVDDAWAALNWVHSNASRYGVDPARVAVGGFSAGGHLSAVLAHLARDAAGRLPPLALQLLAVPVVDLAGVFARDDGRVRGDCPYASYREMYYTQPLSAERMMYFHDKLVGTPRPPELDDSWKLSPIKAPSFSGLAPAIIFTAEMDPLRDEGEAYGKKMQEAGCKAEVIRVKGAPHTFAHLDAILEIGQLFNREAIRALREAFGIA